MIRTKQPKSEIVIDLTGPDGNAFTLMGIATNLAKRMGKDGKAITEEMMAGDYEHLLSVFDREFGDHVILER
jgi:hypothetical protein